MAEENKDGPTAAQARARLARQEALTQEAMMRVGLDLLYAKGDPVAATAQFRKVLEPNPTHYGATFQLAMALDRAGNPGEGRPLSGKVLKMAEENNDGETAASARARLARQPRCRRTRSGTGAGGDQVRHPTRRRHARSPCYPD